MFEVAVFRGFSVVLSYVVLAAGFILLLKLPALLFGALWHLAKPLSFIGFGFLMGLSFTETPDPPKQLAKNPRLEQLLPEHKETLSEILISTAVSELKTASLSLSALIDTEVSGVTEFLTERFSEPERRASRSSDVWSRRF